MSRFSRPLLALGLLTAALTFSGAALAGPSASIEQVRNGQATATTTPLATWGTGNAGASNSHYLESHSIAYRAVMDNLPTDGTVIELVIGYDVKRSGSYALDYLTQYQRLLPHVLFGHRDPEVFDPLAGVSGVDPLVTTSPIPVPTRSVSIDPDGAGPEPAALQPSTNAAALPGAERLMTLYGGTLIDVRYDTEADVNLATSSSESRVKVRFTANGPKAVLAWGGHIACRWDWGFNADGSPRSAGGISGSSYHMRLVGWNLGSLGSQDRSMSTDAVYPVPQCGATNLGPFCANTVNTHTAPAGMESYSWQLLDNTSGAFFVGGTTGTSVVVNSGPNGGSYRIAVTTTASGFAKTCDDVVTVYAPAIADAGADQTVCAASPQVTLAGVASGGTVLWTGGAGTFVPNAAALNALYTPTAAEIAAGGVTLTLKSTPAGSCPAVSDAMRITITPVATANAGADQTLCTSSPQVTLAGGVGGGAASGTWSGGTGTFTPSASALNAVYTPTAAEIAAGSVTLTLTSNDPAGPCDAASDAMTVSFLPAATANAGADLEVCSTAPQAQLAGTIGGGGASGTWSGGAGSFAPNASALNAVYTPTAAEIAAGGVTLTLTTNDPAGPCGAVSDQVRVTIRPAATANAGADQTVCASSPQVTLAGLAGGGATGATWSGGAGGFSPSASALNAVYTPTAAEIAAGSVTLTLTTDDPAGPCGAVSDAMTITIAPAATANAGSDLEVCSTAPQAQLAGTVGGGAASGTWSGGAGSFAPNASSLNAVYTPTVAEIAAGGVTLTLTTNDPAGPCGAVSDQVRITIRPAATANAGPDQTLCSTSPQVTLAGAVGGGAASGTWSGGAGSFSPSASALNAVYTPTAAEIAAGGVTLTLTTNDPSGPCGPVSDAVQITIAPAATANAGADRRVCASAPQVVLAGAIGGGAGSATWSGGAGSFSPNASTLAATYTPSAGEIAAGRVTLTLTTNDPAGPCGAVSDAMTITIDPVTTAYAGLDQTVCAGAPQVTLAGSVGGTVTMGTWSGGSGTFSPSASALNAVYTPSAAEIAAGHVTLTLTSATPSGPCGAASDAMTIFIQPLATANAGPDVTTCSTSPSVRLAGTVGGAATSGTWSGGWGTFSPNENTWNALYTPSASEVTAGSVTLTWTSNDPAGPCGAASDQMKITFDSPAVTVSNAIVCTDVSPVTLCANASKGIAPYTYRWSNGATASCITVADTGDYAVTITDAKGCVASASGHYGQRVCVGQLTHTTATCSSFMDGTAPDLSSGDVNVVLRDGVISSISPGVFFYWTKVKAPATDFTIQVVQAKDNPAFPFLPVLQGQVSPYDANCTRVASGDETSPGQATIPITGAVAGKVYIVSVKYSLKALVGVAMPPGSGVHYDFRTTINGQVVDADPDGLQIGAVQTPVAGGTGTPVPGSDDPTSGTTEPGYKLPGATSMAVSDAETAGTIEFLAYRPMPNPFKSGMRMAYSVAGPAQHVNIRVVDVAGRVVRTLVDATEGAGSHVASWDGRDEGGAKMRNGIYFIHASVGGRTRLVRVTMLQ